MGPGLVAPASFAATREAGATCPGVGERVAQLRHLAAVNDWLAELDAAHGPVPPETLEWAARLIDQWEAQRQPRRAG